MTSTSDRNSPKYEPYICRLTKVQRKFVEEEFFEVDEIRGKWMEQLRQWVLEHPDIEWCRLDGIFLLRFLRYTKFARWCEAPVLAQEALARYLAMLHIYPEWCSGLDPRGELMQQMTHDEIFTILGADSAGQTIVWIRLVRFDVDNLDAIVLLRYTIMFLELMADDEAVQVGGIKVWVDYSGTTWKHYLRFNYDILREFKRIVEKVMPVWIREVHNVGLPDVASSFRTFLCELGPGLFKYKTFWHASAEDARIYFEKANWPEEYGGPCSATRRAGYLKRWFEEKRDMLMATDRMDINVDLADIRYFKPNYKGSGTTGMGIKVKKEPGCEEMTLVKSEFRKNSLKENVQSPAETAKAGASKKVSKNKKKKNNTVKAKVDTGRKKAGKTAVQKEADQTLTNCSCKRESLAGAKSDLKKPWKY